MKPYYEHAGIVIYHGDCRDVLPTIAPDLILTDPPYGIHKPGVTGFMLDRCLEATEWDLRQPSGETLRIVRDSAPQAIVWGFGYFAAVLGDCRAPLVWDKVTGDNYFADGELAWTSFQTGTLRIFRHQWCGCFKASERNEKAHHPTQKPVAVMQWCLSLAPAARIVCDPFMGSGSTLVAAKRSGLQAIGIDVNERYCEIAAERLAQNVLPFQEAV